MCFEDIEEMMSRAKYKEYGNHELLVSLSCVFDCTSRHDGYEYQTEVTFAVPIDWLVDYKSNEESRRIKWGQGDVRGWLQEKYTSEDSQPILEKAIEENKVAFWKIN